MRGTQGDSASARVRTGGAARLKHASSDGPHRAFPYWCLKQATSYCETAALLAGVFVVAPLPA
jgi:hypothetical protein